MTREVGWWYSPREISREPYIQQFDFRQYAIRAYYKHTNMLFTYSIEPNKKLARRVLAHVKNEHATERGVRVRAKLSKAENLDRAWAIAAASLQLANLDFVAKMLTQDFARVTHEDERIHLLESYVEPV